jgi:hypothetical protein
MIYEFPEWVEKGVHVIDKDENEWVIVDFWVTGAYNHDWGILQLEHATIPGVGAEVEVTDVNPV